MTIGCISLFFVQEILDISLAGRAAKQNPTLFALALCARYKVHDTNPDRGKSKQRMAIAAEGPTTVETTMQPEDESIKLYEKYIALLHQTALLCVEKVHLAI